MKNHNPERIISDIASTLKPEYRYDSKEDFALWQERTRILCAGIHTDAQKCISAYSCNNMHTRSFKRNADFNR